MGNFIIIILLIIIVIIALKSSINHLKGQGSCCGGNNDNNHKSKIKKLTGEVILKKIITIDGIHCKNCKYRIEKHLNSIDGVYAKVNLSKNIAIVSMDKPINDNILKSTIESLDFKVLNIKNIL